MTTNRQKGNTWVWVLVLLAIAVIAYFVFRSDRTTVPEPGVAGDNASRQEIVVEGDVVCLPHRDTSGPTTLECAYGLKDQTGAYYGLDTTRLPATTPPEYEVGDRISVEGTLVPTDEIPGNFYAIYNIKGMIAMDAFWKFTEK